VAGKKMAIINLNTLGDCTAGEKRKVYREMACFGLRPWLGLHSPCLYFICDKDSYFKHMLIGGTDDGKHPYYEYTIFVYGVSKHIEMLQHNNIGEQHNAQMKERYKHIEYVERVLQR
jgi:hypothetical protein